MPPNLKQSDPAWVELSTWFEAGPGRPSWLRVLAVVFCWTLAKDGVLVAGVLAGLSPNPARHVNWVPQLWIWSLATGLCLVASLAAGRVLSKTMGRWSAAGMSSLLFAGGESVLFATFNQTWTVPGFLFTSGAFVGMILFLALVFGLWRVPLPRVVSIGLGIMGMRLTRYGIGVLNDLQEGFRLRYLMDRSMLAFVMELTFKVSCIVVGAILFAVLLLAIDRLFRSRRPHHLPLP